MMILSIISCLLFVSTVFFAYHAYRFAKMVLSIQDAIEESLELMNARIASVSRVLEIPLFYDSPEIRKVHEDLKASKDAIMKVAQTFSTIEEGAQEDEEGQ
jgi:hypothetical protein